MATQDLHTLIKPVVALPMAAIIANGTTAGTIFDTTFFESIEFSAVSGSVADGQYKFLIEDANDSGFNGGAPVASEFLVGDPNAVITTSDTTLGLGYIGHKRFVRANIVSTGVTVGVISFAVLLIADRVRHIPVVPTP